MLSKQSMEGRYQVSMIALDQIVPENHLVRKIEKALDFNFIYDLLGDKYSMDNERPSNDPVVLFSICLEFELCDKRSEK